MAKKLIFNPLLKKGLQQETIQETPPTPIEKAWLLRSNVVSTDKTVMIKPTADGIDLSVDKVTYYKSLIFSYGTNSNLEVNKDSVVSRRTMANTGSCCVVCFDKYILVGDLTNSGVSISKDYGATWNFISLGASIRAVAYKNGVWVAISNVLGKLFTSTDDLTSFQQRTVPTAVYSYAFANDSVFVALAYGSANALISTDGITWTSAALPANVPVAKRWSCGCVAANERLVVFCNDSNISAYSDDNGLTWTSVSMPTSLRWYHCIYDNGKIIAIATDNTNKGAISTDEGLTWTEITLPATSLWRYITKVGDKFLVVASNTANAATSTDGITWQAMNLGYTANWYVSVTVPYQADIKRFEDAFIEDSALGITSNAAYDGVRGYTAGNIFGLEYLAPFQNKYIITSKLIASPKIIFTGDSTNFTGSLQSDNTKATANAPSQLFTTKIMRSGIPATVIQSGVSGQTASYWRTSLLAAEIAQNPDCFILKWGINDQSLGIASLTATMNAALASIRAALPKVGIVLCVPNNINGPYNMTEAWVKQVSDLYRSIARTYQCVFYDEYRMFMDINVDYTVNGFVDEYMDTFDVSSYGMTNHFAHIHPKMIFNSWQADTFFNMLYPDWVREYASARALVSLNYSDANVTFSDSFYVIRNNVCYVQIFADVVTNDENLINTGITLPKPFGNVSTDNVSIDDLGLLSVRAIKKVGNAYSEFISYPVNL